MRKLFIMSGAAVLVLSLMVGGALLAQEEDATTGAWLGVTLTENEGAVMILRVTPGSPASASGLLIGDVVEAIDGETIESVDELVEIVQGHKPGDEVTLGVQRYGKSLDINVTVGTNPTTYYGQGRRGPFAGMSGTAAMGMGMFGAKLVETEAGYEVTDILPSNPFGLEIGDVITEVEGQPVAGLDWHAALTEKMEAGDPTLSITVERNGETQSLEGSFFGGMHNFGGRRGFGGMHNFGGRGGFGGMHNFGGRGGFPCPGGFFNNDTDNVQSPLGNQL